MRNPHKTHAQRRDHYQELTDKIIAALEAGTAPWRRPWDKTAGAGATAPVNAATGHRYRGINLFVLGMSPLATSDPRWCSYRQAAERGWQVRKGEKATPVYFYKPIEIEDSDAEGGAETRRIPILRTFSVFHASQIDGIPDLVPPSRPKPSPSASRTSRSSSKRAASRCGSAATGRSTALRSTSFRCLRTKPFTVQRYGRRHYFMNWRMLLGTLVG